MVAFCDILGFSNLVGRRRLEDLVAHDLAIFRRILHYSLSHNWVAEPPSFDELHSDARVDFAWFSDSIFLYSRDDSDESVRRLVETVSWLLFATITGTQTRVRGAISYGDVFIDSDNDLFVGQPIVEAARLEATQEWAGAALTPAAVERVPISRRDGHDPAWPLRPYLVPAKHSPAGIQTLAVDWTWGIHELSWSCRWSDENDAPPPEAWTATPDLCTKFTNTRQFHDTGHCCSR